MKKLTLISLILSMILASCKEYGEVRIMPEFNNSETEIQLYKNEGYSKTVVISTTANEVTADYNADWLSVDANKQRIIYTALTTNETGETRSAIVKLNAGEFSAEVTVSQLAKDESEMKILKVGQLTEDGLGMIFWVDPDNQEIGKAISLERWGGNKFEANIKLHNAFSTVNGIENTAMYTDADVNDAAALCTKLGEGWYLPASEELGVLFDVYNGIARDNGFTNATPNQISDSEKASRAAFDKNLTDLGGTVINAAAESGNGESYWSSTENEDGQKARYVRFGKYAMDFGAKTGTSRYVRAMKVIGDYKFPEEPATLTVSPMQIELACEEGATAEVTVTTNKASFAFVVEGNSSTWLSAVQNGDKIKITTLSKNDGNEARTGTVTVTAGSGDAQTEVTVTVIQKKEETVVPAFKIGDYVKMDGDKELAEGGIVFWVDGNNAKILSLKRSATPINWANEGFNQALGLTDQEDGEGNTKKMKESSIAANIPILEYCKDGWYIPARREMEEVFNAYNGGASQTPGSKPNAIKQEEKDARAAWDKILTDNGGDVMNAKAETTPGDSYFTSTEAEDATKVYYVRFGQWNPGLTGVKYSASPARYVRCIRKISK